MYLQSNCCKICNMIQQTKLILALIAKCIDITALLALLTTNS